jgi:hypothetical protein
MTKWLVFATLALAACSDHDEDAARIGEFSFEAPVGWHAHDASRRGELATEWMPDDNPRKESITVIVADRHAPIADANDGTLDRLLASAQGSLHGLASAPVSIGNKYGLEGARVDVSFVPPGLTSTYHRVHVVLSSGNTLVHVLYTTRDASGPLDAFNHVVSTLRRGEG